MACARALAVGLAFFLGFTQLATPADQSAHATALQLLPISRDLLERCERSGLLRPICPRLVPEVPGYRINLSVEQARPNVLDVFTLEYGGEYPQNPARNRPPGMAHIVAVVGNLERLAPFREPVGRSRVALRDGLLRQERASPVSFGRAHWAGRLGRFYLMPSWPRGGMLGNHLVFSWREHLRRYALSLHGWEPLTESAVTLRKMVEALPDVGEAGRLARLSPVRWLPMSRGPTTARGTIAGPSTRRYSFDVSVFSRRRDDIEIRIGAPGGSVIRIFAMAHSSACFSRPPFRYCFARAINVAPPARGVWTIVAVKRSQADALVRVDVRFQTR